MLQQYCDKTTVLTDFQPLQKIGQGSFSSVYRVRRISDGKIYALKKVKVNALTEKEKNNALNQIRILASLSSPFIVEYKEAFYDHKLNLLCIVMEYASEGDLQKKIATQKAKRIRFTQQEVWKAVLHMLEGLSLLHQQNILHRDLKTANIFISEGMHKIGDLNVSKVQGSDRLAYTQTGTPYYASPQVWRDEPYDCKSDIWSLGCIVYEICTFSPPFYGKGLDSLFKSIQRGFYHPIPLDYSKVLSDFIALCLSKNPKNRLSSDQLLRGIVTKKCKQYKIKRDANNTSPCNLLKTILFPNDTKYLNYHLPSPRYDKQPNKKKTTEQTLQNSRSNNVHSQKNMVSNRYFLIKVRQDNQRKGNDQIKSCKQIEKVESLKQINSPVNRVSSNLSHRLLPIKPSVSKHLYIRNRHLIFNRKEEMLSKQKSANAEREESTSFQKRYQQAKNQLKKINSSEQHLPTINKHLRHYYKKDQPNVPYSSVILDSIHQQKMNLGKKRQESRDIIYQYNQNPHLHGHHLPNTDEASKRQQQLKKRGKRALPIKF